MAEALGRGIEIPDFAIEIDRLTKSIKTLLWDAKTAFYYDTDRDGIRLDVKVIYKKDTTHQAGRIKISHLGKAGFRSSLASISRMAALDRETPFS